MTDSEKKLYDKAKQLSKWPMTDKERAEQRVSFAYGNTKIKNDFVIKQIVSSEAVKVDRQIIEE